MISQRLWEQVAYKNINKIGSFGRVRLARNKKTGEYFAMKILKKADIIKLKQVDHVISENTILADIDHPFLV
jgi:protein kinase A